MRKKAKKMRKKAKKMRKNFWVQILPQNQDFTGYWRIF